MLSTMRCLLASIGIAASVIACGDDALRLPLAAESGDVAAIAFWKDGAPRVALRPFEEGRPFEVDADRDRPVYTFLLESGALIDEAGQPLDLTTLTLRTDRDLPSPDACGRCLAPTSAAPMTVHAGSTCGLPAFAPAAVWRASDGDTPSCAAGPDGRLCATGLDADRRSIEEIRRQLRLVGAGTCACRPSDATRLDGMTIDAITPAEDPWPLSTWALGANGDIAGFRRELAIRYDPATGRTLRTRIDGINATVRRSVGLRDGSFLVAGQAFNASQSATYAFYRLTTTDPGFATPTQVMRNLDITPFGMAYLGADGPLHIFGTTQRSLTTVPQLFICADDLECAQARLSQCPVTKTTIDPLEGRRFANGAAIVRAERALYLRASTEAPTGEWACRQPDEFRWLDPTRTDPAPRVEVYASMAVTGDRAFVCARSATPACTSARAMVLTATVGTGPAAPDPDWRIAHLGAAGSDCWGTIALDDGNVRATMSGRYVDFDHRGRVVGEGDLADAYGPVSGRYDVDDLSRGVTVHRADGNRYFVDAPGRPLRQIYGPTERPRAHFAAAVALPDGRWVTFADGFVRLVSVDGTITDVPASGDAQSAVSAALDPSSPDAGPWSLLVGDGGGRLARLTLSEAGATFVRVELPSVPSAPIRGIAAVGEGRFVVAGPGPNLLRVDGSGARLIPLNWDNPATDRTESEPTARNGCTQALVPADVFRGVDGRHGVAWAVGVNDLVFRVTPDRAERHALEARVDATAVVAQCPDIPRIFGQLVDIGGPGFGIRRLRAYSWSEASEGPDSRTFRSIAENDIIGVRDLVIRNGRPIAGFADGRWSAPETSGFAVTLTNGFVHRIFSGQPPEYVRVPFDPDFAVPGRGGAVLFGAGNGRLAIGRPASP